jgi:hypothetical protein
MKDQPTQRTPFDSFALCVALEDAINILRQHRKLLASGSSSLWNFVDHAIKHLDAQIAAELMPF